MGKKITSFLVLLTALLLTLPTQAQTSQQLTGGVKKAIPTLKAMKKNVTLNQTAKVVQETTATQQVRKERISDEEIEFQRALAEKQAVANEKSVAPQKKQSNKPTTQSQNGFGFTKGTPLNRTSISRIASPTPVKAPLKAGASEGEVTNSYGIITTPAEGEHKFYTRSGTAYYPSGQQVYSQAQSGHVEIVETEDGTIYIKDLVGTYGQGTWVKGTKTGNTISIPTGQPVAYNTNYSTTLSSNWGTYDDTNGWAKDTSKDAFTFTVDGDVISLQGSNEDTYIGIFWDDDNSFSGYGDYESVYTLDADYAPTPQVLVELPSGVEAETWYTEGTNSTSSANTDFEGTAQVAFDGNDVYLSGFFTNFPNAWIKGTLSGSTVTFAGLQYIGNYGSTPIFATGTNGSSLTDFTMTYDASAQTLTANNALLANGAEDKVYYLQWISALTILKEKPEATVIDELPYSNDFETTAVQKHFTIIDANGDGKTWTFASDNSGSNAAKYSYNSAADADDWLISPAIKLEAGKHYHFAIDARSISTYYPERVEVKLGGDLSASALTQQVIAATDLPLNTYVTLENESVTVPESGYYYIGIHAISDADMSSLYVDNFLIEAGAEATAPAAVTDLTVVPVEEDALGAVISFKAPTKKLDGTDLTENIAKIEILRDGNVIGTLEDVVPGSEQTYTDLGDDLTIGTHVYQVIPYDATGVGEKSEEISVFLSATLTVPYIADFTETGTFDAFQVLDANGDNSTWTWNTTNQAYYSYNSNNADDYLITSPIKLEAGKNYKVTVNAKAAGSSYAEKFEVLVGKEATAAGLTQTAISETEVTNTAYEEFEGDFNITEDGIYYIAIHAISDADKWRLSVSKFAVEKGLEPTAPAAPELTVTAGAEGDLSATVKVIASTKTISGDDLTENLSKLEILRDGEVIATFSDVAPGATERYLDEPANGTHEYQAIPYDANGDVAQKSEKVSVFVGQDIPNAVENLTYTDNQTSLDLTWDPVSNEGANGGYVNPEQVDYLVWTLKVVQGYFGNYLDFDEQLAEQHATTSYTVEGVENTDEGEQTYKYYGVQAKNDAGTSGGVATSVLIGAPYELPFSENFEGKSFHYLWESDNVGTYISSNSSDEDGVALNLVAEEAGEGSLTTGKLNLNSAANPTLFFDVRTEAPTTLSIVGSKPNGETTVLNANVPVSADYTTVKVALADAKDNRYSRIAFVANFAAAEDSIIIDNIKIVDLYEYNLSVDVTAPKTVKAGNTATAKVTVKNIGENVASGYTVKLYAGEEELLNETVADELGFYETKEFTAEYATTIFSEPTDVTLRAEVEYALDLDEDDNVAETVIAVVESSAAAPENVTGIETETDGVQLTWDAPSTATEEVTEDFEDTSIFETFSIGGITAENHYGAFGDWKLYDGDGEYVYGWENSSISYDNSGKPAAWQVFNPVQAGFSEEYYTTHSGNQFLMSQCAALESGTTPSNDWIISPELPGVAQTISFYASQASTTDTSNSSGFYGYEKFEVYASSTDSEIESFTKVGDGQITEETWTEFSFNLPEGTKYFAIRHTSEDVFALFVDDITYQQGGGSVVSYNIYVDGVLVATVEGDVTTYLVSDNLSLGDHEFSVSAVYANGQESKPVTATVTITNSIQQISVDGKPVDIYSIDGKLVRSQAKTLDGLKGVYVVNGKKILVK